MLRNISEYNRWSEWWHLDLHKASQEILSECWWNGCSLICVLAARKLPCNCYRWNKLSIWGCSPTRNKLKLWNQPLLTKPREAQRAFLKWPTPENHLLWGSTLSSKALRWHWREATKILPQTLRKSSNGQALAPCSISKLETPKRNSIRSSQEMDYVLPLKTAQSLDAKLHHQASPRSSYKNTDGTTSPEQALEVPRGWGWDLRTETLVALNSAAD